MHLLLNISLLESPGNLTMFKLAPFVRFSEPLPVVFGVNFRTLATEHFHIVAAYSVIHGTSKRSHAAYASFGASVITSVWSLCEMEALLTHCH
jgi:hypothetical protein